jgi:hypothetical protein
LNAIWKNRKEGCGVYIYGSGYGSVAGFFGARNKFGVVNRMGNLLTRTLAVKFLMCTPLYDITERTPNPTIHLSFCFSYSSPGAIVKKTGNYRLRHTVLLLQNIAVGTRQSST